jgi:hypothetical protein
MNASAKHLTEDQMVSAYYDGLPESQRSHLADCAECRASIARFEAVLEAARDADVPDRPASYGAEVWARLQPRLPQKPNPRERIQWWQLASAFATLLLIAFVGGMWVQHRREPLAISPEARTRVLLIAMSDHLDRSEMVLAELVNADPAKVDLKDEQSRARDLIAENRLLRETALHAGDTQHAAVLDELERALLDIANSPAKPAPADLEDLQRRIENDGLLFKVRVIGANVRQKGQTL